MASRAWLRRAGSAARPATVARAASRSASSAETAVRRASASPRIASKWARQATSATARSGVRSPSARRDSSSSRSSAAILTRERLAAGPRQPAGGFVSGAVDQVEQHTGRLQAAHRLLAHAGVGIGARQVRERSGVLGRVFLDRLEAYGGVAAADRRGESFENGHIEGGSGRENIEAWKGRRQEGVATPGTSSGKRGCGPW